MGFVSLFAVDWQVFEGLRKLLLKYFRLHYVRILLQRQETWVGGGTANYHTLLSGKSTK